MASPARHGSSASVAVSQYQMPSAANGTGPAPAGTLQLQSGMPFPMPWSVRQPAAQSFISLMWRHQSQGACASLALLTEPSASRNDMAQ